MAKCWLIGDRTGRFPLLAGQYARLRNIDLEFVTLSGGHLPSFDGPGRALIAMTFEQFRQLDESDRDRLNKFIAAGGTLYFRGGLIAGDRISFLPLATCEFTVISTSRVRSYRFERHPLIPVALAGEESPAPGGFLAADSISALLIEPLVVAKYEGGIERPLIFAIKRGSGLIVLDLSSDDSEVDSPMVSRFADPLSRPGNLGPLVAANHAAGFSPQLRSAFNLTLDDRPANRDYFNVPKLVRFQERARLRFPELHVDFAWTPNQSHPSYKYLSVLREFDTGFIWHGFYRHIDHSSLYDPEKEYTEGIKLVDSISQRYEVRFQRIMLFPFSRDNEKCVKVLHRHGFRGKVETAESTSLTSHSHNQYLKNSRPQCEGKHNDFAILYRAPLERLHYDWMLAQAALGLPLLASANPSDMALTMFSNAPWNSDSFDDLDRVLDFAAAKQLRPMALEDIAAEVCAS